MQKIVINKCYGGFGLSHKAVMRYAEIKGIKLYPYLDDITKNIYKERATFDNPEIFVNYTTKPKKRDSSDKWINDNYFSLYNIERTDPALIQVVSEMGNEANSRHSELKIVNVPDGVEWEIEEYDGFESIHEKHRSWG